MAASRPKNQQAKKKPFDIDLPEGDPLPTDPLKHRNVKKVIQQSMFDPTNNAKSEKFPGTGSASTNPDNTPKDNTPKK